MENVTDRTSNPFGMRPPCESPCSADVPAVFGYGDANAVHGGRETGVPFTDSEAGAAVRRALYEADFADDPDADEPELENCFLSYLHMCCSPEDSDPAPERYDELDPFFDAELRAIAAHVLVPVGERATRHVIETYTARASKLEIEMAEIHATEIRGSGFLVVPVRGPLEWDEGDSDEFVERLLSIRGRDYRETADLSRFLGTDELYYVR